MDYIEAVKRLRQYLLQQGNSEALAALEPLIIKLEAAQKHNDFIHGPETWKELQEILILITNQSRSSTGRTLFQWINVTPDEISRVEYKLGTVMRLTGSQYERLTNALL